MCSYAFTAAVESLNRRLTANSRLTVALTDLYSCGFSSSFFLVAVVFSDQPGHVCIIDKDGPEGPRGPDGAGAQNVLLCSCLESACF